MLNRLTAVVSLALLASGCQYIDQITGAPKKLNDAEAAIRYLEIACKSNKTVDRINEDLGKLDKKGESGKMSEVLWAEKPMRCTQN